VSVVPTAVVLNLPLSCPGYKYLTQLDTELLRLQVGRVTRTQPQDNLVDTQDKLELVVEMVHYI